ncbi:Nn.00g051020.m01.CDS01 [Neocucurbitaria sp. VM-36]
MRKVAIKTAIASEASVSSSDAPSAILALSPLADSSSINLPQPIKDNEPDSTYDEEEESATTASCLQLALSNEELFSTTMSGTKILELVSKIIPALSPSESSIRRLRWEIQTQLANAPKMRLPALSNAPTTWPSTNPDMDSLWQEGVDGEQKVVALGLAIPQGLDMRPAYLVKPFGSFDDPLLVLSSYPTADPASTVHLDYGIANDLSNSSMSRLYTKLGFHVAGYRTTGMLHVDIFPRRLDRKVILGNDYLVLTRVPKALLRIWEQFTFKCLDRSGARVSIVSGHAAACAYQMYLEERSIPHDLLWLYECQRSRHELPCGCIEWNDDGKTTIRRLTLIVYHPESFSRQRGYILTNLHRNIAFRERLFDYVSVLLYGEAHLPTFLSTGNWFYQMSTGILIPLTAFEEYNEGSNDTLSKYLSRPTLDTHAMRNFIRNSPTLSEKGGAILNLRNAIGIKPEDAVAYWSRPAVLAKYGSYSLTYELMTKRYIQAKQGVREKPRKRMGAMSATDREVSKKLCITGSGGHETVFEKFQQRLLRFENRAWEREVEM